MAKKLDATSSSCFTTVSISASLILGTKDDYILRGRIDPFSVKIVRESDSNNDEKK